MTTSESHWTHGTGRNCILCSADSLYNYYKPAPGTTTNNAQAKCWTTWRSESARSLRTLLSLSESDSDDLLLQWMTRGPFCTQCSSLVWDIHFTITQIKTLKRRLGSLKENVEEKIQFQYQCTQLYDPTEAMGHRKQGVEHIVKKLAQLGLKREPIKSRGHIKRIRSDIKLEEGDEAMTRPASTGTRPPVVIKIEVVPEIADGDGDPDWVPEMEGTEPFTMDLEDLDEPTPKKSGRGRPRKGEQRPPKPSSSGKGLGRRWRNEPKQCILCPTICKGRKPLEKHMDQEHPDHFFECTICPARYKRQHLLDTHVEDKHGAVFPLHCTTFRQGFQTQDELTEHEGIHNSSNPFTCSMCNTIFSNSKDLRRHVSSHFHEFKCTHPGCEKTFGSKKTFQKHFAIHTSGPLICETCGKEFGSQSALYLHRKRHRQLGTLTCDQCGRMFKNEHNLKEHMKIHQPGGIERPHVCRFCGKSFMRASHLKRHEEIHSGTQLHICSQCGKRFATKPGLYSHEIQVHDLDPERREQGRIAKARHWKKYYANHVRPSKMKS